MINKHLCSITPLHTYYSHDTISKVVNQHALKLPQGFDWQNNYGKSVENWQSNKSTLQCTTIYHKSTNHRKSMENKQSQSSAWHNFKGCKPTRPKTTTSDRVTLENPWRIDKVKVPHYITQFQNVANLHGLKLPQVVEWLTEQPWNTHGQK